MTVATPRDRSEEHDHRKIKRPEQSKDVPGDLPFKGALASVGSGQ
jgi:hypothetical protein